MHPTVQKNKRPKEIHKGKRTKAIKEGKYARDRQRQARPPRPPRPPGKPKSLPPPLYVDRPPKPPASPHPSPSQTAENNDKNTSASNFPYYPSSSSSVKSPSLSSSSSSSSSLFSASSSKQSQKQPHKKPSVAPLQNSNPWSPMPRDPTPNKIENLVNNSEENIKKPQRKRKQRLSTVMKGKLVHSLIHKDKSLENEILATLEASLENQEQEASVQPSSWHPPPTPRHTASYPTIASKLVDMPEPEATSQAEFHNNVADDFNARINDLSPNSIGGSQRLELKKSELSEHRKGFKYRKRKPFKPLQANLRKTASPFKPRKPKTDLNSYTKEESAIADNLIAPAMSNENDQEENQVSRVNADPYNTAMYGDPIVMSLNDQEFKVMPSIVYDTSPSSQNTGSIIKELFSDQLGAKSFRQVREYADYSPPQLWSPTAAPSYSTPPPTRIYQTPSPTFSEAQVTASYAELDVTPTSNYYQESLPTYTATPPPPRQAPQRRRDRKPKTVDSPICDCLASPLPPACSSQCPAIASDRQGLGVAVPILSQTQQHNQDPAQSHAYE